MSEKYEEKKIKREENENRMERNERREEDTKIAWRNLSIHAV